MSTCFGAFSGAAGRQVSRFRSFPATLPSKRTSRSSASCSGCGRRCRGASRLAWRRSKTTTRRCGSTVWRSRWSSAEPCCKAGCKPSISSRSTSLAASRRCFTGSNCATARCTSAISPFAAWSATARRSGPSFGRTGTRRTCLAPRRGKSSRTGVGATRAALRPSNWPTIIWPRKSGLAWTCSRSGAYRRAPRMWPTCSLRTCAARSSSSRGAIRRWRSKRRPSQRASAGSTGTGF
mmetsp:Transcript_15568/g.39233  ORF Transcript_15568/g.39233 Transcript_15568/m.39233 type:complete len:236 (+) Transcript_15568:572-1279(+)